MFHLLQPIWMLAAAGIIIPVAIHLWNVRQGKTLKVGSIAFLTQSSKNVATSLKLTEWLLLMLRCLLIVLLAILFAKPVWDQSFKNAKEKGWVLIGKENVTETYHHFQPLIDSLIRAGYEFHYFNPGFKKDNLQEALKDQKDSMLPASPMSYRLLVKELDRLVPAALPVYLFTTNYVNSFAGNRGDVSLNMHWHTYTPADSVAGFISKAYAISADSIRIMKGNSNPYGTAYTKEDIGLTNNLHPDFHLSNNNSGLLIAYRDDEPVAVDTSTLRITIFTTKYPADAAYIKAAVEAIEQFSRHTIRLLLVNKVEFIPAQQDWIFWLSELAVPATVKTRNLFKYEEGEVKNTSSWINTTSNINGDAEKIALFKLITSTPVINPSQQVWQDGFGNNVLSLQSSDINTYLLFTHLDPSWNDLPWSSKFPQLIYTILYPADNASLADKHDKRIISEQQLLPGNRATAIDSAKQKFITTDISPYCWLAAFIVFFIERFIALRTRKEVVNA